jgi:WhiB family redox-sensing transcriptional regulator
MIQPQRQLEEKSPVKGDLHAGICGSRGVRFPSATRLPLDTAPGARQVAAAKAICARCPVLAECRSWAISHEAYGIWGGLTEHQRARLRRHVPGARGRTSTAGA